MLWGCASAHASAGAVCRGLAVPPNPGLKVSEPFCRDRLPPYKCVSRSTDHAQASLEAAPHCKPCASA